MKALWARVRLWMIQFLSFIKPAASKGLALLQRIFKFLFGDVNFQWKAPPWVFKLAQQKPKVVKHKKAILWSSAGLLAVGGIAFGIHLYLDSLPKPEYCQVAVDGPRPRDLESNIVDKLELSFSCSAAPVESLGKVLTVTPELSPKVAGSWHWETDRRLVFTPTGEAKTGDWPVDQQFKIHLPKKVLASHIVLEKYKYEFQTEKISFSSLKTEFYIDPTNPKIKKAVVNLSFNYPIDTEDFRKHVEFRFLPRQKSLLNQNGKSFNFTVSFNKLLNQAYLLSDVIPVPEDESVMVVTIGKGFRTALGGRSDREQKYEISVPGKKDAFKITDADIHFAHNAKYEPEQVLVITSKMAAKSVDIAKSLKVYVLPRDKNKDEKDTPYFYRWSVGEMSKDVLSRSQLLTLEPQPTEQETSTIHSFKLKVPPKQSLYVHIQKGVKALDEYELMEDFKSTLEIPVYPRELTIMSEGALLSLRGEQRLPVLSRGVETVKVHVSKLIPDQLNQVIRQAFRYGQFAKPSIYDDVKDTTTEQFEEEMKLMPEANTATHYFSVDLGKYLQKGVKKRGLFYLEISDTQSERRDRRFVLLTDIGIIAKKTALNTYEVFVQSLSSGLPLAGANVEVMGANGIALFEAQTDANGHVSFPNLDQFSREKRPVAFVVQKEGDLSFIPMDNNDRKLTYSKFDVGGVYEQPSKDQVSAMIFSDRSLYRPGESIRLALLPRSKDGKRSFKDVPLTWSLSDPRGTTVKTGKMLASSSDLKDLTLQTEETWYTGTYNFSLYLVKERQQTEMIGSTEVRVEEFLPDQMKISSRLSKQKVDGWVTPEDIKATVNLKNLFGTPAENRRIQAVMTVIPFEPRFGKLKEYRFAALNKKNENEFHAPLSETTSDVQGDASFDLDLNQFNSGMYLLRFEARGFDANGGRSVNTASSTLISPLPYLAGLKPDGDLNYIKKDAARKIHILAVDSDLKNKSVPDLNLQIIERRYVSVLTQNPDGTYKYQSVLKETPGENKKLALPKDGLNYTLNTAAAGEFTLVVKNAEGVEINRLDYSVMGQGNLTRALDKNAELQVSLDKADYRPGDEIELQVKAPYVGAGLITIERDRIYATKWFKTSTTTSILKIKIPEGLEGNAYVNVTFLRSLDSKEIFTSPLSYGVSPFAINLDSHKTKISLEAPSLIKPGQKLNIKYSANRKTSMVIWGVDEGILLVAKYKEPKPLDFFFQKRALQVSTWQILDLLLPEFSLVKETAGVGGDSAAAAFGRNLNPFKRKSNPPAVFWSGVIEAGPEAKEYSVNIPEYYNGNIKIFAVAADERSYGNETTSSLVRGDFVITPTAPLAVSPGDEFELGVGVSNQASGSGDKAEVKVELSSGPSFEIVGEKIQKEAIGEGREGEVRFRVKTLPKPGSGKLTLHASSGGKSARYSFDTSVRPSVPYKTEMTYAMLEKSPQEIPVERQLYPDLKTQNLSLSPSPLSLLKGLESYFQGYPYSCTEQLISKAVPALFSSLEKKDRAQAEKDFNTALEILRGRQHSSGGFSLYPGGDPHLLSSIYALHYLTEAKDRGFSVPGDLLSYALNYVKERRVESYSSLPDLRLIAYGLYLQGRNGVVATNQITFLRSFLNQKFKDQWEKDDAGIFLAGLYKLVKMEDAAEKLLRERKIGESIETNYGSFYDQTVRDSHLLMITAKHAPHLLPKIMDTNSMRTLLKPMLKKQYNSYSSAALYFGLGSLSANGEQNRSLEKLLIEQLNASGKAEKLNFSNPRVATLNSFDEGTVKFKVTSDLQTPVFFSKTENGFDRKARTQELKSGLEISRVYTNEEGKEISTVKVGEEIKVHLRVRTLENKASQQVAIVDLFPGGFEYVFATPVQEPSVPPASEEESHPEENAPSEEEHSYEHESEEGDSYSYFPWLKFAFPTALAQASGNNANLTALYTSYVDNREERVIIYTHVDNQLREYVYKLKATNVGDYVVPGTFGEDLYDRSIRYEGVPSKIRIEK